MVFLFKHESTDRLDPGQVDEIATYLQQGWSMDKAITKVGRKSVLLWRSSRNAAMDMSALMGD